MCVCVLSQTPAAIEPARFPSPQFLEEPNSEPEHGAPVLKPAVANPATNPKSDSHITDLQVCFPSSTFSHFSPLYQTSRLSFYCAKVCPTAVTNDCLIWNLLYAQDENRGSLYFQVIFKTWCLET